MVDDLCSELSPETNSSSCEHNRSIADLGLENIGNDSENDIVMAYSESE